MSVKKQNKDTCKGCEVLFPLAIAVAILLVIVSLTQSSKHNPAFTIETISSTCMTEMNDFDIRAEGNSITVIAPIQTPNPCYSVIGDVKFSGRDIDVDLFAVSKQNICIQCTGEVTGKVVIQNLTKGTYDVKVIIPDKTTTKTIIIE